MTRIMDVPLHKYKAASVSNRGTSRYATAYTALPKIKNVKSFPVARLVVALAGAVELELLSAEYAGWSSVRVSTLEASLVSYTLAYSFWSSGKMPT